MKHRSLLAACSLLALCACGGNDVKETLGLEREPPDEFRVVARPPLAIPPQFNLRAPSTSDESPTAVPTSKQAESLVLGTPQATTSGDTFSLKESNSQTAIVPVTAAPIATDGATSSQGDSQFLKNIGAEQADPNVRQTLAEQKIRKELENPSWWDKFSSSPEKKDTVVDAKKEAERIKTNQETGKPLTEGQTPESKPADRGVLGRILGD